MILELFLYVGVSLVFVFQVSPHLNYKVTYNQSTYELNANLKMKPFRTLYQCLLFVSFCTQITAQSDLEVNAMIDIAVKYDTLQTLEWNIEGENICDWQGVTCDVDGHIIKLDLSHFYFEKDLPASFGDLNYLESLDIHFNNFTTLPASFSNLSNLEKLSVRGCFEGSLPTSIFDLSSLKQLDISQNNLNILSTKIENLTSLEQLNSSENNLKIVPDEIADLTHLKELFFNENDFESIPTIIKSCPSLISLSMKGNHIETIDPTFFNSNNIKYLYLDNNNLTAIPSTIAEADSLVNLFLDNNNLSSLPSELSNLKKLQTLSLSSNKFVDIPCVIADINSLVNLYFKDNVLESINDCLLNSEQLYFMTLRGNQLKFEDLEKFVGVIPFYVYAPQDSILEKEQIYLLPNTTTQLKSGYENSTYRYKWYKNEELIPDATDPYLDISYDSLSTGTYTCSIVNTNLLALELWRNNVAVQMIEPIGLDISDVQNVSCNGYNDGRIEVLANGATGAFDYNWSNGEQSHTLENLEAGEYHLTITDQLANIEFIESFIVQEPNSMTVEEFIVPATETLTGSIELTVFGGTPPYNYIWNNDLPNNSDQENLQFGEYQVEILDANGCNEILEWYFEMSTSIAESNKTESFNTVNFYPNPTNSFIYIESDYLEPIRFELVNAQGQKVLSSSFFKSLYVDISHLNSGVYFLKIEESDQVKVPKTNRLIKL